jgi:hypothetical protein
MFTNRRKDRYDLTKKIQGIGSKVANTINQLAVLWEDTLVLHDARHVGSRAKECDNAVASLASKQHYQVRNAFKQATDQSR